MSINNLNPALEMCFKNIKLLVLDVDGVMTDGGLTIGDDGQEYKTFHSHDGLGMKLLKSTGVQLAIITGRTSNVVKQRAETTGVAHFYQGAEDKLVAFQDLLHKTGLSANQCAFMGDDIVDLPPMLHSGLALAVPDSPHLVLKHAHYVTTRRGGQGAVREICELIMQAQGTYDAIINKFLMQASMSN
ncbi:MAG TPA: HAD hydrolase family protein [Methylotenera sp.]|nr:HAD hydrolase family protein [Methylotenera sp.]HPH06203.1 HAD hydrolase family protein [Methylotenera sp.]HPN00997.1 HAD hydrolase family protein [Methylotenera sp.]